MMKLHWALLILFVSLGTHPTLAALITSGVNVDTLTPGDRVELTVGLVVSKGALVTPPPMESGIGGFVVKDWLSTKTEQNKTDSLTYKYLVTNYTVGLCTIPALPYLISHGDALDTVSTQPIPMSVGSVIPAGADTVDIKELKPQQVTGRPSLLWLWLLLTAVAAALTVFVIRRQLGKSKKVASEPPPLPPYEEAVAALKRLDAQQFIMKGMVREHVFELSEIFKRYLGRRFESTAAEFTTEEMLHWLRTSGMSKEPRISAEWFFDATDPVKFAKFIPDTAIIERFDHEVRTVLEATRPVIQAAPQADEKPGEAS